MLLALLVGATWTDPTGRYAVSLSDAWTWASGPVRPQDAWIEGQLARADRGDWGLVVRPVELAPVEGGRRVEALDLDGMLSPDRVARVVEQAQDEALTSVFVGPADGVDAGLGRWVYLDAHDRLWWQIFWRVDGQHAQAIAWAPRADAAAFVQEMRAVESAVTHPSAVTVLFDAGRSDCPAAQVDRGAVLRDSQAFETARGALRQAWSEHPGQPGDLALAELRTLGVLYRKVEQCVHAGARSERACLVHEGPVRDARDAAVHQGAVACLDRDDEIAAATALAVRRFLP